jgi:hypothetical protein
MMIVHRPVARVSPAVEAAQRFLPVAGIPRFVVVTNAR